MYLHWKLEHSRLKASFLHQCRERKVIPSGLQLTFNLAVVPQNSSLLGSVQNNLDNASSRLLDLLYTDCQEKVDSLQHSYDEQRAITNHALGHHRTDCVISQIKERTKKDLQRLKQTYMRKLTTLNNASTSVPVSNTILSGSLKIRARTFIPDKTHKEHNKKIRKHRRRRERQKMNRLKPEHPHSPCKISTPHPFDPVVLAKNIQLTDEQISICRLSDKFAPTPREPVDACDQLLGTHAWAERLRWHHYHQMQKQSDDSEVTSKEEHFEKLPWYKPTKNCAPKKDHALETFIAACQNEFMRPENRNRISDNLTKGQRRALNELRLLPVTHKAACRFADKTGNTVITDLSEDDEIITTTLKDKNYYDILPSDPTQDTVKKIKKFTKKWAIKGAFTDEMVDFIQNIDFSHPGKCKPLTKTHKPPPYPVRLLLSGSGTPVQPLSKVVQLSISHLTSFLPYQILDTKEFLQKVDSINKTIAPLPDSAVFVVCDVISLYPNVDNTMGIPATKQLLAKHPSHLGIQRDCVLEALELVLNNNSTKYEDVQGDITVAKPNRGIAMGPAHACDFVDIFMGEIDEKVVSQSPIPLLTSLCPANSPDQNVLNWSRFRDDAITILPDRQSVPAFERHLESVSPPSIKWTVLAARDAEYLDMRLHLKNGRIISDVFSKHCHSYLPPTSCHAPSVFKGLISSVGTRLRLLCSEDETLKKRIDEYAKHFELSGWNKAQAKKELQKGSAKDREHLLQQPRKTKGRKLAWVTKYDPRLPSKAKIIQKNLHLLYANPENKEIFPRGTIISADRRRKNLAEIYKPTTPHHLVTHGPKPEPGFHPCSRKACDTCAHSLKIHGFSSPWDGRKWTIRKHLTCTTPNVIYIIRCIGHEEGVYIGSTQNLKLRWANHKSDIKLNKTNKCTLAQHMCTKHAKVDTSDLHKDIQIFAIDSTKSAESLLKAETWWQANVGTVFSGLNVRKDLNTMIRCQSRIIF